MAVERIINLRVDTGDSNAKIEQTTSTLDKLNKKVVELEGDIESAKKSASEPIKLDVKTDKSKIDALVASMGNVEEQKEILGDKEVKIEVDTNLPEANKEVQDFGKSLAEIEFDKTVKLAIDASQAASTITATQDFTLYTNNIKLEHVLNLKPLSSDPSPAQEGDVYYRTGVGPKFFDGSVWRTISFT